MKAKHPEIKDLIWCSNNLPPSFKHIQTIFSSNSQQQFLSLRRHSPAVLPRKDRKPCSPLNMAGMPLVPQGTCHVNTNAFELAARTHQRIVIWHLWSIPWASPFLDIKFADVQSSNLSTGAPDRYSSLFFEWLGHVGLKHDRYREPHSCTSLRSSWH